MYVHKSVCKLITLGIRAWVCIGVCVCMCACVHAHVSVSVSVSVSIVNVDRELPNFGGVYNL